MKALDLSQFVNGMPKEIEIKPKKLKTTEKRYDDPVCLQYLAQIYKQQTGRHLFKDTRKETKK